MVTLRNRPRTLEMSVNPKQTNSHEQTQSAKSEEVSGYEQCREKRIRENVERMQKLGIFDLSSKFKSAILSPKRSPRKPFERRTPQASPLQSSLPARRSSRLQNATPISYAEELPREKRVRGQRRVGPLFGPLVGEGPRTEIYTEEHEKLLGTCEGTWTLFVDGCGLDGRRVYDQIKGKTCHQCRQKTLGHRTHCSRCNLVTGQFCGDCLYMRYGEHVLEANQNPDWICPPCRGICNCSLCRQARGWPATGQLYRKVLSLGFKSVAHYLIQTRRAETKSDIIVIDDPVSAKKSLPFEDTAEVAVHKDILDSDDGQHGSPKHVSIDELNGEKEESLNEHGVSNVLSAREANPDSISRRLRPRRNKSDANINVQTQSAETKLVSEEKEEPMSEHGVSNVASGTKTKCKRKSDIVSEPNPGSVSGRLRQRRNKSDADINVQTQSAETKSVPEEKEESMGEHGVCNVASGTKTKPRKSDIVSEPNPDSISGRLRQRRNRS